MYQLTSKLIIYRSISRDSILFRIADAMRRLDQGKLSDEEASQEILEQVHRLLDLATVYGFNQNLWQNYLAYLLAMTETPFTLVAEKEGAMDGSVNTLVENDLHIFKQLFDYDFAPLERKLGISVFSILTNFHAVEKKAQIYNKNVSDKVQELSAAFDAAATDRELYQAVTSFYGRYGVGMLGLNKAFRVSEDPETELLVPITNTLDIHLEDIVGYEMQKKELVDNTQAFVAGRKANNVLLYGDAGTGKSTSVKAILNAYYSQGLRIIEIYKHQFQYLAKIINQIKNRNYRFVIYMDDLSFEESELEYKYLKAIIEGGLEPKPENVLIYATSNRKHLVRETWRDKTDHEDDDVHKNDTVQEKLSLSARFGLQIGYFKPSPKEFIHIVETLAARYPELTISQEELRARANVWELSHGGFSGRTAQQFIDYLLGSVPKSKA
mgnify:FL=1